MAWIVPLQRTLFYKTSIAYINIKAFSDRPVTAAVFCSRYATDG